MPTQSRTRVIVIALVAAVLAVGAYVLWDRVIKGMFASDAGPLDHVTILRENAPTLADEEAVRRGLNAIDGWETDLVWPDGFAALAADHDGAIPDFSGTDARSIVTNVEHPDSVAANGSLVMVYFAYPPAVHDWLTEQHDVIKPVGFGREDLWLGAWAIVHVDPGPNFDRAALLEYFHKMEACSYRSPDDCEIPDGALPLDAD